jgi:drug/metabolite transporter (DMT)-like permease
VAVVPLTTLLLATAWGQERLALVAVASTVPAIAGVALLSWQALAGPIPLVYLLALLGGALCISQAAVVVRAFPPVHPVTMNAVGMAVGAVLLLALSALRGDH